jgi:hypothetical protein
MAAGMGLTPEQRQLLLQALIRGGGEGMGDPAAALRNIMQAQGGASAAQAIVAGLRDKLIPGASAGPGGVEGPLGRASAAARGLSGEEPNYAKVDDRPGGILSEPAKPAEKKPDDVADAAKKLAEKTPEPPASKGILGDVPPVPDVPDAGRAVRSAVSGSLREAARRGQGAMPSERQGPIAITETITKAALRHGVDPVGLIKTAGIESHFNPSAKNPKSSAGGLFQFIDSTAKSYGLSNKYDAAQASDAAARLWKDNRESLAKSLGRDPTNGELYLAHQQGIGGALKIIRNPGDTVASTVGKSAAHLNAGSGMTNRQFADMWTRRMEGAAGGSQPENRRTLGKDLAAPTVSPETAPTPSGVPLPPRRPDNLGVTPDKAAAPARTITPAGSALPRRYGPNGEPLSPLAGEQLQDRPARDDAPLTVNVTPSGTETPALDVSAPDPDFADITDAEQASLGGDDMGGIPDIGGLLGGLDSGDAGAEEPSQFQQDVAQDDAEKAREPDKPLIPEEDKQASGILSGDSGLLGGQDQDRVDLARVFSPEGMGGTGLFGRDQAPETTGFKAPVGLPTAGPAATLATPSPAAGILGAPSTGIASITPPQLRSIAPAAPLPPPRPADLGVQAPISPAPTLAPPDVPLPPGRARQLSDALSQIATQVGGTAVPSTVGPDRFDQDVPLPPRGPVGIEGTLPPPRPVGIGGEIPTPPRRPDDIGDPFPTPPRRPDGLLGNLGLPPVPDVPAPNIPPLSPLSPPASGPGMGGPNPPWQDPPKPTGILGTPNTPKAAGTEDNFARFAKDMGILSGAFGQSSSQMGASRKPSGSLLAGPSRPLVPQEQLLTSGLLSNPRQGMDLNRFFGLLSGRVG